MHPNPWTPIEIETLTDGYNRELPWIEISAQIGRTPLACEQKAQQLGIKRSRAYTNTEIDTVRRRYPTDDNAAIAKSLGIPIQKVYRIAHSLGVAKLPAVKAAILKECGRRVIESGKSHRFKKGDVPANKGLRRPGWAPGRMADTQFKKGGFSANRREIGDERVCRDGYTYVKVADGQANRNWKQKHWIVWEEQNGPIPAGGNVLFRDGNKKNFDISNLQLVTDAELMSQNTVHNLPAPVKDAVRALGSFRRKLNTHAKKQNRRSA